VVDDLIGRVKDREPVDWRYDPGEDVYVIIKAPQLTIHIKKYFLPSRPFPPPPSPPSPPPPSPPPPPPPLWWWMRRRRELGGGIFGFNYD
jgi:hypothetical protein